jgi:uncharacterized iron-regulated membrane protein
MCATGIVPMLLVGTGLWVWLRKRRGERIARARHKARIAKVKSPSRVAGR